MVAIVIHYNNNIKTKALEQENAELKKEIQELKKLMKIEDEMLAGVETTSKKIYKKSKLDYKDFFEPDGKLKLKIK
ncbi:MAG: hypothetical protein Hyperionvirus29_17 [Hyperionvirus sp.]|uniref:Uncharacterized protein n=1 Tax=Hyperionvirus sp. TaxID=2487770 RepID=A0A3G5AD70_9VIRU|nr:MAG: hypothetical protein Hyperionvirus29_17 [Hyperionvirus sp.]